MGKCVVNRPPPGAATASPPDVVGYASKDAGSGFFLWRHLLLGGEDVGHPQVCLSRIKHCIFVKFWPRICILSPSLGNNKLKIVRAMLSRFCFYIISVKGDDNGPPRMLFKKL